MTASLILLASLHFVQSESHRSGEENGRGEGGVRMMPQEDDGNDDGFLRSVNTSVIENITVVNITNVVTEYVSNQSTSNLGEEINRSLEERKQEPSSSERVLQAHLCHQTPELLLSAQRHGCGEDYWLTTCSQLS